MLSVSPIRLTVEVEVQRIPKEEKPKHEPVMVEEVLRYLDVKKGGVYVDATCGLGGHTKAILKELEDQGLVVAIDRDPEALKIAKRGLRGPQVLFIHGDYKDLVTILSRHGLLSVDGVLFDLGVSSFHLDFSSRGFRYMSEEETLDMRFDPSEGLPAYHYINSLPERELAGIFFYYGEIKEARAIARAIVRERRRSTIRKTGDLNRILSRFKVGKALLRLKMRVYQALRIYVNDELYRLYLGLMGALRALKIGGRLVVLSYHSLEDRMVKRLNKLEGVEPITKKPLPPSQEEVIRNPRARSAKLRALKKISSVSDEDIRSLLWPLVPALGPGYRE
jgi:16S rRNA (cytosine1402-N4)-methyltransferase